MASLFPERLCMSKAGMLRITKGIAVSSHYGIFAGKNQGLLNVLIVMSVMSSVILFLKSLYQFFPLCGL